jgi:malonyl CoA-acyl carrier protein transacylase
MTASTLEIPSVAAMFTLAESVLGYDLKKVRMRMLYVVSPDYTTTAWLFDLKLHGFEQICLEGPKEKLDETNYAQPALLIAGLAAIEKLRLQDSTLIDKYC